MDKKFYRDGLRFSCTRCSSCCRYESGFVFLSETDAASLIKALHITRTEFEDRYCRWVPNADVDRLSLKERKGENGFDCIFWNNGCAVYENRPLQCRSYPFWEILLEREEAWKNEAGYCPGLGQGTLHSFEEIEAILKQRASQITIERKRD